eukprot:Sdes_comp18132_c0_seq1m7598
MFVHIFPEGRVIYDRSKVPFKWGVGRLIVESKKPLVVIPFWHVGMEDVCFDMVFRFSSRFYVEFTHDNTRFFLRAPYSLDSGGKSQSSLESRSILIPLLKNFREKLFQNALWIQRGLKTDSVLGLSKCWSGKCSN